MDNKALKDPIRIIMLFLGFVFVSAAVYRIFVYNIAKEELVLLRIPTIFVIPLILLEIVIGLSFLFDKYTRITMPLGIFFLGFSIVWTLFIGWKMILSQIGELFILNIDITDVFIHIIYLFLIVLAYYKFRIKPSN